MDINDIDFEDEETTTTTSPQETQEHTDELPTDEHQEENDEDLVTSLLHKKGIADTSKIKFENENGSIEEVPFDNLTKEEQLNILTATDEEPDTELSDDEIALINDLRSSNLTPEQYIEEIKKSGAMDSTQNIEAPTYTVDQYDDDSLFIYDQQNRYGLTEEEAQESLNAAKSNETLYAKQIQGIRADYKQAEDLQTQQALEAEQQQKEAEFNEFQNSVINEVGQLQSVGSMNMDMTDEEKNQLATFILDKDQSGVNYLARALNDPKTLVKMAWFALHGDDAFTDLDDYVGSQIKEVSRAQYDKGYKDGKANKSKATTQTHVVTTKSNPINNSSSTKQQKSIFDLD